MVAIQMDIIMSAQSQPHIAIFINSSWNFVNFRAGLIRTLIGRGYLVTAIAPDDQYATAIGELGCMFILVPMNSGGISPVSDTRLLIDLTIKLRKLDPDLLLTFTPKPNIYGSIAARALSIPAIANIAGLGIAFSGHGILMRTVRMLYQVSLRHPQTVFFQNTDDLDRFVDGKILKRKQAELLPGSGVDLAKFAPAVLSRTNGDQRKTFLLAARLVANKGIREYVAAARIIKRDWPAARFQILGFIDPNNSFSILQAELDEWIAEGVIEYMGRADDVRPYLAAADCVVLPTYYPEGTPRILLEAAAMAKPIITTDLPGCRDVVEPGVNGFYCLERSADSLAEEVRKICRLSQTEIEQYGRASRLLAERKFDESFVVSLYFKAVEKLLTRN